MATTEETLRLAGDLRIVLDAHVDATTRALVNAWAETWQTLTIDWGLAYAPLIAARAEGRKATRTQILRAERTTKAMIATRRALEDLARRVGVRILQPVDVIVRQAAEAQTSLILSQLPTDAAAADLRASLARVDQKQLEAIVARTTEQVTSLVSYIPKIGMQAINQELIRGVALGLNPRGVARDMVTAAQLVSRMERAFILPLNRAMIIARTELLDAHRNGAWYGQNANRDVLAGWQWLAKLDTRTCPSCWGNHGSIHELWESGPDDHQQGRCARLPVTKPWSDLGLDIPEPPSLVPDAQSVFDDLPEAEQLRIMGRDRLDALKNGDLAWNRLSIKQKNDGWRDSYVVRPVPAAARQSAA